MYQEFDSYPSGLPASSSSNPLSEGVSDSFSRSNILTFDCADVADPRSRHPVDLEQILVQQLLSPSLCESSYFDDIPPSLTTSLSQGDLSMSPAAMFLSAFSPSVSSCAPLPDDEGQLVAGHILGPVVGRGGFSTIRAASSPSGDTVAIKIVLRGDLVKQSDPEVCRRRLDQEAQVWASLHHEHILPLFTAEHTPYADYFITQYCPAGSLFDILKRDGCPALPQDDVGTMFRQVVRGLQYMHEVAGYVHGDIKLENILVDEMGVCKIGDFGMARKIGEIEDHDQHMGSSQSRKPAKHGLHTHLSLIRHTKTHGSRNTSRHRNSTPVQDTLSPSPSQVYQQGSLPYAAPELLLPQIGTPYLPHPAQDIWALGVMLYTLLTGRLPFRDSFEPRLQMKILNGVFEMPAGIGRGAERVLKGCMDTTVANRWTISVVDEVGWGVGWGEDGDNATPELEDETPRSSSRRSTSVVVSRSRSRPRSRPRADCRYSPMAENPASRSTRSSSRSSRSTSRSAARDHPRYIPPSLTSLTSSILGNSSRSPSSYFPSFSRSDSTDAEVYRGRQLNKAPNESNSRSVSPSVAPMTPTDTSEGFRAFFPPMKSRTNSGEHSPDSELGRARFASPHIRGRRGIVELSDIEENSRWASSTSDTKLDSWAVGWDAPGGNRDSSRAESVPRHIRFANIRETSWTNSTPVPVPRSNVARSRSLSF